MDWLHTEITLPIGALATLVVVIALRLRAARNGKPGGALFGRRMDGRRIRGDPVDAAVSTLTVISETISRIDRRGEKMTERFAALEFNIREIRDLQKSWIGEVRNQVKAIETAIGEVRVLVQALGEKMDADNT